MGKNNRYFFGLLSLLVCFLSFPLSSQAVLQPLTIATGQTGLYDPVSTQFLYWDAAAFTSGAAGVGAGTTYDRQLLLTSGAGSVTLPLSTGFNITSWHMATPGEFDSFVLAAGDAGALYSLIKPTDAGNGFNTVRLNGNYPGGSGNVIVMFDNSPNPAPSFIYSGINPNLDLLPNGAVDLAGSTQFAVPTPIGAFAVSNVNAVPEPSTYVLLFIALAVVVGARYKMRKQLEQ
jgi:hypothetical protein